MASTTVSADSIIPEPASLRLANGSNRCAGRVEVLHQEEWGAVCDHGWDEPEDKVVCRQLGCGTAMPTSEGVDFGAGPSRVWLDNVKCQGTERDLRECWASVWGESKCEHGRHASVVCSGGSHSHEAPVGQDALAVSCHPSWEQGAGSRTPKPFKTILSLNSSRCSSH